MTTPPTCAGRSWPSPKRRSAFICSAIGQFQNAVVGGHLVGRAAERAFGARAVVTADVDDQRVVELAHVLDCLDHAADLVVGVGRVAGEHFGLRARTTSSRSASQRVPLRQVIRPGRELGVRRDHAEPLLVGEDLLAQLRPSPCRTCP